MSENLNELEEYYRKGDHQFRIAGGEKGIIKLVNDFYDIMETIPEAKRIRMLHPDDLTESREKLGSFLCFYMDGPPPHYMDGTPALGAVHRRFPIGDSERDAWLLCMKKALNMQDWPQTFKEFMMMRFCTTAARIQNG